FAIEQAHGDEQIVIALPDFTNRQVMKILVQADRVLDAVLVDLLLEIPVPIKEPDRDKIQVEIAGRFTMVAGENAEAAGIVRDRFVKTKLGRELGDRLFKTVARLSVGVLAREIIPVGLVHLFELTEEILVLRDLDEPGLA